MANEQADHANHCINSDDISSLPVIHDGTFFKVIKEVDYKK